MSGAVTDSVEAHQLAARVAVTPLHQVDGSTVMLRDWWRSAPTVNVFMRQFGCLFCHQQVDQVLGALGRIRSSGAELIIVGCGTTEQARGFYERKQLPRPGVHVLTNPDRSAYQAAEMKRSFSATFASVGSAGAYLKARGQGYRIRGAFGDVNQLGGTLVVMPPANPLLVYRSTHAGDHPDVDEVVGLLEKAA